MNFANNWNMFFANTLNTVSGRCSSRKRNRYSLRTPGTDPAPVRYPCGTERVDIPPSRRSGDSFWVYAKNIFRVFERKYEPI